MTSREAIELLAKVDLGLAEMTPELEQQVRLSVVSYIQWWMEPEDYKAESGKLIKRNKSEEEALALVKAMKESDKRLLSSNDIYADHLWSRGEEVGITEINLLEASTEDQEAVVNTEWEQFHRYWGNEYILHLSDKDQKDHEHRISQKTKGINPEVFNRSTRKMEDILSFLAEFEGKTLSGKEKLLLQKVRAKILQLRFGIKSREGKVEKVQGGGELIFRHWAICFNKVNELLGIKKRIILKEVEDPTDAMGEIDETTGEPIYRNNLVFYGGDPETLYNQTEDELF